MTRVAMLGDIHLGRLLYGHPLTDCARSAFYEFFDFCVRKNITTAICLGDIYDTPKPSLELQKILIQVCNEFERAKITLHLLAGNHEVISRGIGSALGPLKSSRYAYVRVYHRPQRVPLNGQQDLIMAPFPSPGYYSQSDWEGYYIRAYRQSKRPALVFSHLNVEGAVLGDQEWVYRGGDYVLPSCYVKAPKRRIPLIVSGHIHKQQVIGKRHLVLGAAQRLRFSEKSNPCSIGVVKVADSSLVVSLHALRHKARLIEWVIDATQHKTLEAMVKVAPKLVVDALVKVRVKLDISSPVNVQEITNWLYERGARFVIMSPPELVQDETQAPMPLQLGAEPLELAKEFLQAKLVDETVIDKHLRLFKTIVRDTDSG